MAKKQFFVKKHKWITRQIYSDCDARVNEIHIRPERVLNITASRIMELTTAAEVYMSIHSYIVGSLKDDVEKDIKKYEELTWIDDFMSNASKPWFYEYTIQGFIYYNLVRQFDFAAKNKAALFFLEQPYARNATENRADIMIVEFTSHGEITSKSAIEIKTDFELSSIYTDMVVMANHIDKENISRGYGIFFGTSEEMVEEAISILKNDKKLKPYFSAHKLYAIGMVGQPE